MDVPVEIEAAVDSPADLMLGMSPVVPSASPTLAAPSDATWHPNPSMTEAKRWHVVAAGAGANADAVPACCASLLLCTELAAPLQTIPASLRCRRGGRRQLSPSAGHG